MPSPISRYELLATRVSVLLITVLQTMLRRTEGSSKEEQIIQKEQILAELQVSLKNIVEYPELEKKGYYRNIV